MPGFNARAALVAAFTAYLSSIGAVLRRAGLAQSMSARDRIVHCRPRRAAPGAMQRIL